MCYYTGKKQAVCGQHSSYAEGPMYSGDTYKKFMCAKVVADWDDDVSKQAYLTPI